MLNSVYLANQVRNETAENFLSLMKEWEKLCSYFSLVQNKVPHQQYMDLFSTEEDDDTGSEEINEEDGEVFEVSEVLAVCYGDPNRKKESGLYFKVVNFQEKLTAYFFALFFSPGYENFERFYFVYVILG